MQKFCWFLLLFSTQVWGLGDEKLWPEDKPKNFCLDPDSASQNDMLVRQHPNDPRIVKLVALRTGLCDLLEKNIVTLETAIDLFDVEKDQEVLKRLQEGQTAQPERTL